VNFDLSHSLELLHAFREYLTIVSNTDAQSPLLKRKRPRKVYNLLGTESKAEIPSESARGDAA
jgi:hypothetical protein